MKPFLVLIVFELTIWVHAGMVTLDDDDFDDIAGAARYYRQTTVSKQELAESAKAWESLNTQLQQTIKTINATVIATAEEQREKEQLTELLRLPSNYNKFEVPGAIIKSRPGLAPKPILILVSLRIRNIRAVDVLNEEMCMELDLIVRWNDTGISQLYRNTTSEIRVLDSEFLKQIWWPKLIFSRSVSIFRPDLHGSFWIPRPVRLSINPRFGEVEMSSRLVLKIYCPMDFLYYPADTQKCKIRLRAYAKSVEHIQLRWQVNSGGTPQAFFFNRGHPNYDIRMYNVTSGDYPECVNGNDIPTDTSVRGICPGSNYTYLEFSLATRRKLTFHILQTYVPSLLLVVITWLAFFIPIELLEARIGISMTILLTLTAMFGSIKEYTPPVSYQKSIDIWMLSCIVFVFLTLFEFTFLMYLRHVNEKAQAKALESNMESTYRKYQNVNSNDSEDQCSNITLLRGNEKDVENFYKVAKLYQIALSLVETYGFITVSVGFLIFNMAYWPSLLTFSSYGSFDVDFTYNEP